MYGLKVRYLASVFVDAGSITPTGENIAGLQKALDDNKLIPTSVREETPTGRVPRIAFATSNGEWLLALLGKRFDVSRFGNTPDGSNLGEFSNFCEEAAIKLITMLNYFKRKAHRLAAIQEGLLPDMPKKDMNKIAARLLNLPTTYSKNPPFEWDWRAASKVERSFSDIKESINTIATIRRVRGTLLVNKEDGQGKQSFDRVRVDFDINTVPTNVTARFDDSQIAEFFKQAILWHDELSSEIFSFILKEIS